METADREVLRTAVDWLTAGETVYLATVAKTFGSSPRPPGSLAALRADVGLAVVTRSEKGCLVVSREETQAVHAYPVEKVVDTTGAGDLFAAGFLFGLARDADEVTAARLGALAAAEVIGHLGARPEMSLKTLAAENGLAV